MSDDDVRKRLLEQPCFEQAAKAVSRLGILLLLLISQQDGRRMVAAAGGPTAIQPK